MRTASSVTGVVTVIALAGAGAAAAGSTDPVSYAAPDYHVSALEPVEGDVSSGAGITNSGLVAGASSAGGGTTHATVWVDGEANGLGTLGGPDASSAVLWPVKNNSGIVVGISQTDRVDPHGEAWSCGAFLPERLGFACVGFVWKDGRMHELPTLGGTHGFAAGVNNRGQVVGWAENAVEDPTCVDGQVLQFRAVRWDGLGARTTELPPLGDDTVSAATAVNDDGRTVGISGLCDQAVGRLSARHAVVWDDGRVRRLPDLGGIAWNTPMSVNQHGDAVGFVNRSEADGQRLRPLPVMWSRDGDLHELEVPDGYTFGQALGINARREVVGVAYTSDFTRCTAMLWSDGDAIVLQSRIGSAAWDLCNANDINDDGQITGQGTDLTTGRDIGFVLHR